MANISTDIAAKQLAISLVIYILLTVSLIIFSIANLMFFKIPLPPINVLKFKE